MKRLIRYGLDANLALGRAVANGKVQLAQELVAANPAANAKDPAHLLAALERRDAAMIALLERLGADARAPAFVARAVELACDRDASAKRQRR